MRGTHQPWIVAHRGWAVLVTHTVLAGVAEQTPKQKKIREGAALATRGERGRLISLILGLVGRDGQGERGLGRAFVNVPKYDCTYRRPVLSK